MKASTQYDDLVGTSAADISYGLRHQNLEEIANALDLDQDRFELIGLSLSGTRELSLSLLCVDRERSDDENEYLVSMAIEEDIENVLNVLFERFSVVLHARFDDRYPNMDYNEEVRFSDFHEIDEEE